MGRELAEDVIRETFLGVDRCGRRMAADPGTNRAILRSPSGEKLAVLLSAANDAMVI